MNGLILLQKKIDKESISKVRWYRKGHDTVEVPVPILGPDLIDVRRIPDIKAKAAELAGADIQSAPTSPAQA